MKYLALLALLFATPAFASTVLFVDPVIGELCYEDLQPDGTFSYRIQAPVTPAYAMPIESVLVTDDTGQMAPGCYPLQAGQTILVTSETVVAAQPVITVTGVSYSVADCTGEVSVPSNPIVVTFTPEPPWLLEPLSP
jgi:hypothetical protein